MLQVEIAKPELVAYGFEVFLKPLKLPQLHVTITSEVLDLLPHKLLAYNPLSIFGRVGEEFDEALRSGTLPSSHMICVE